MNEERLFTVAEVAARLRTSQETIRRWLRSGRLRGIRLGGTRAGYRIAESDLQRFLDRGELAA